MNRASKPDRPAPRPLGSIRGDEAMPSEEFRRRFGMSDKAWRAMLRRGLRAIPCGKIKVVMGSDALEFFRSLGESEGHAE